MSSTKKPEKNSSKEKEPENKSSFLVEDAAAIEMTSESGKQTIEKVDPALRPKVKKRIIEGEVARPSHPSKPRIDEDGIIRVDD